MKLSASILLSFLVLILNIQNGLHLIVYEVGKPIIIKNYCVNKEVQTFQCDGKCHLKKVLEQDVNTASEQDIPAPNLEIKNIVYFCELDKEITEEFQIVEQLYKGYINCYKFEMSKNLFKPPAA